MMNRLTSGTKKWAILGAVFFAATSHAQDVCTGADAIAGTVNSIKESGPRVFVLTSNSVDHPGGGGLYISCDEGKSWHKHPMINEGGLSLVVDPADEKTIYAGIGGGFVYISRNAGETWEPRRSMEIGNIGVSALAARSGGQVIAGGGTGELRQSDDFGETWATLNGALPQETIHTTLADPLNTNRLLVAVGNDGIYQSLDGGQTFAKSTLAGLILPPAYWPVRDIAFAPADTSQVFSGSSSGLWLSVDGGSIFSSVESISDLVDISFGRRDTSTMFVVSEFEGLLRADDGGQSFELMEPNISGSSNRFKQALQLQSGRLLIGTVDEGIYTSDDDGSTWQSSGIEPPPPSVLPSPPTGAARLSVSIENLNGNVAVELGTGAEFRIVVRNNGPDVSTDTYVQFEWTLPDSSGTSSKAFDLSSNRGPCYVGPNAESACTVGTLPSGQSVTIEFSGNFSTDFIGTHSINATASNAEGAHESANDSVASKKSIACYGDCDDGEGGGGSTGLQLIGALSLLFRRRYRILGQI